MRRSAQLLTALSQNGQLANSNWQLAKPVDPTESRLYHFFSVPFWVLNRVRRSG
jgi:hypothetical protein